MSVYTTITEEELQAFLTNYSENPAVGSLVSYEGISAGIENTNYFVDTENGRFVLTIFEQHSFDEMGYFLDVMHYLHDHQVPSANPVATNAGSFLLTLKDKPAALVERLKGGDLSDPDAAHCRTLGEALGHLHSVGQDFPGQRDNDRGHRWWKDLMPELLPKLSEADAELLKDEVFFQSMYRVNDLPQGLIHADLFRDNALFDGDQVGGIIDFYYACNYALLYDVAVTINDWCSTPEGALDVTKAQALFDGYRQNRPLKPIERGAWPVMLRAAALRFWVSRLKDKHFPREGELTHIKDPDVFKNILLQRRDNEELSKSLW